MEEIENKAEDIIMLGSVNRVEEGTSDIVTEEEETVIDVMEKVVVAENTTEGKQNEDLSEESNKDCKYDDKLDVISNDIKGLTDKIEQMNQLFVQKIAHTTHEEKVVDQMHAELQKYKDDMYAQLVRPILLDIIAIRDSIIRMSAAFAAKPDGKQNVPLKTFCDYSYDVQDILEKNNITIYDSKEGDDFSPIKQRAIKKITTPVEELHGKIAESMSSGYEYMGKPISPEKVVVYVYQKPENKKGDNE